MSNDFIATGPAGIMPTLRDGPTQDLLEYIEKHKPYSTAMIRWLDKILKNMKDNPVTYFDQGD